MASRKARRPDNVWFGLLITGTAYETWALRGRRREATFSYLTRKHLRTETVLGRMVFTGILVWFWTHILTKEQS